MCNKKWYDVLSVSVSLLSGIVFTILAFLNLLTAFTLGPILGIALGAFSLVLLTLGAVSLLRQEQHVNRCICAKGKRLLISALLLMAISAFAILFVLTNLLIALILVFVIAVLFVYTLFSLYCYLACLTDAGCHSC